jgi:hypothetical protein
MSTVLPRAQALPIVGNLPQIAKDPLGFLLELGHTHGDLATYRIGAKTFVLVNNPGLSYHFYPQSAY